MPAQNADICGTTTITKSNTTEITFTNNHPSSCTANDNGTSMSLSQLIGESSITVPARSGSTPGTLTKTILTGAPLGTYSWARPTCCGPERVNPQIILQ